MTSILRNLFRHLTYQAFSPGTLLRETYESFKAILARNKISLELMAELETIYHDCRKVDLSRVQQICTRLGKEVSAMVEELNRMSPLAYTELPAYSRKINFYVTLALETMQYDIKPPYVLALRDIPSDGEGIAGGKAWRLSLISRELGLPVPDGFVATASACRYLIEANDLKRIIDDELSRLDVHDTKQLQWTASKLVELIWRAEVPNRLFLDIMEASQRFTAVRGNMRFAVRSSAIGEDGPLSFAGQHQSILNVNAEGLIAAYKQVIASKYSPKALHYRISNGLIDVDMPMAVLFLPMLEAESAGVIYTVDPTAPSEPTVAIHAVRGLGEALMSGTVSAERYDMTRDDVPQCMAIARGGQSTKTVAGVEKELKLVPLEEAEHEMPCLHPEDCVLLAQWALRLETFFGVPLDIEWCRDTTQGLMLLQARPLHVEQQQEGGTSPQPAGVRTLIEKGARAAGGCASGHVFLLTPERFIDDVPQGAVLVATAASPDLSRITHRLAAAVFEFGSPAGHFASVARECGLPTIVQVSGAMGCLRDGMPVTVDAECVRIYEGVLLDLSYHRHSREDPFLFSPFRVKTRKALDLISPLNLTDPESPSFAPEGCRTLHDIIRFCHERALHEMFSLGRRGGRASRGARRLRTDLPIVLYLLDISAGALQCPSGRGGVRIDEIDHAQLHALWRGLSHPDIYWSPELLHIDWEKLEQVTNGAIMSLESPLLASFAILSHDYLNLSIRFGYHFAVIDSLCSETEGESYILFSFKGGGSAYHGIMLRVRFLIEVLRHNEFNVIQRGDLVEAERAHCSAETVLKMLTILGALLGCTRLLDYVLDDEQAVARLVEQFLSGDFNFHHLRKGRD